MPTLYQTRGRLFAGAGAVWGEVTASERERDRAVEGGEDGGRARPEEVEILVISSAAKLRFTRSR
jgi:hypothetical protein